ncbi:MAG: hypothetical protein K0R57_2304 [Paenibacillaceae bacterium]|jgi:uncharacterized protein YprB with RNaseH-like and TPR domain|nr:hypothetical protein [Paenibacillaceae bacterium]
MSGLKDRLRRLTGTGAGTGAGAGKDGEAPVSSSVESGEHVVAVESGVPDAAGKTGAPAASGEAYDMSAAPESYEGEADSPVSAPAAEEPSVHAVEALDSEWSRLGAAMVRNSHGSFIRRRCVYPRDHRHGGYALADLFGIDGELSAFHADGEIPVSADKLLFFDTETTGLGLGAGNVPFMVGLGFWEEDGFAVEQMFIRNPAEELAMLSYLKPLMERYPYLVTYNGRSFDWPLMLNRFVMNRMKEGIAQPLHLDFLYASRSLWRNTLPSCRLGKVEEVQLGFTRVDDMPGSMAPELYFLYLAEKQPQAIAPVFLHNELDVLSLAGLAVLFAQALGGQTDASGKQAEEQYRLGLWLHKMGRRELSMKVLQLLYDRCLKEEAEENDIRLTVPLAAHYKQLGEWERAVCLWERAVSAGRSAPSAAGPTLAPYVELSMYHEHRAKDYGQALLYAEEALVWAERRFAALRAVRKRKSGSPRSRPGRSLSPLDPLAGLLGTEDDPLASEGGSESVRELDKRVQRLRNRLLKATAGASGGKRSRAVRAKGTSAPQGERVSSLDHGESGAKQTGMPSSPRSSLKKRQPSAGTEPDALTLF